MLLNEKYTTTNGFFRKLMECHKIRYPFSLAISDASLTLNETLITEVYTKTTKQKLRNVLKQILKLTPNDNIHKFFTLTDNGSFIESIRKNVNEKQIDCIVMGTKGASELEKIILGSNTADVITKVKCNVLAIPETIKK